MPTDIRRFDRQHRDHMHYVSLDYTGYLSSNNKITATLSRSYFILDSQSVFVTRNYFCILTTRLSTPIGYFLGSKQAKTHVNDQDVTD